MLEEKISSTLKTIHSAFAGVQLDRGISWREADVIDDYGMEEEREKARSIDEKLDWSKLSDGLIESISFVPIPPTPSATLPASPLPVNAHPVFDKSV